jgi:hypothetical protein
MFLNVRRKRLLVSPFGKNCDINERLTSERFRMIKIVPAAGQGLAGAAW